ncbi:hypothetical protein [Nocardia sp. CA-120079]|uniref:hypothetical protein n=1 Tax=Nocardia sp. CA-120079 TaxID=3239974 RepID=UPI003D953773
MTYQEAAKVCSVPVSAVHSRITRTGQNLLAAEEEGREESTTVGPDPSVGRFR